MAKWFITDVQYWMMTILVSSLLLSKAETINSKGFLEKWKEMSKERQGNQPDFDEKKMSIITINMDIERPVSALQDGDDVNESEISCLSRRLSDEDGEIHIVGYKPEIHDDTVDKMVLYGCTQLTKGSGTSDNNCIDQCLGPAVVIYEWQQGACPHYLTKGEIVTIGGPFIIHELVLEIQHRKGEKVSSEISLKAIPELAVRSDKTVEKLIAYYESLPDYKPCSKQSSVASSSSLIEDDNSGVSDNKPENIIKQEQEAYPEGDYRYPRGFETSFGTNGVTAEEWWPRETIRMGQVAGVATDQHGLVYAFQRGERRWLRSDFDSKHMFKHTMRAIQDDVVLMMDPHSGYVLDSWGAGWFYMPHGITIDNAGNMWLTDVALHQVFKFPPGPWYGRPKPSLVLGKRFEPGADWKHFCQPTDVAVDSKTGNFFVADGYCNSRILKFAPNGSVLMEITAPSSPDQPEDLRTFDIPHSLALAERRQLLCVADREHARIVCFNSTTGEYDRQITSEDFGGRIFAIAYDEDQDVLYAVNGPTDDEYYPTQGFTIGLDSGRILSTWNRPPQDHEQFIEPHDLATYSGAIYVADVGANRVWKFWDEASPSNEVWDNQLLWER